MQRLMQKHTGRQQRHRRVRARVIGTAARPRISVFRSAKHFVAQLIDDAAMRTVVTASDREVTVESPAGQRNVAVAHAVGKLLAERARAAGCTSVIFDRGGYAYHGRVRAAADGAREGGLQF